MLTFLKVAYVFFLARMAQWYCVGLESLFFLRRRKPSGKEEPNGKNPREKKNQMERTLGKRRTKWKEPSGKEEPNGKKETRMGGEN